MERSIWKFVFPEPGTYGFDAPTLEMPEHAEILCVREQVNRICLWANVIPSAPIVPRRFRMVLTGVSPPSPLQGRYLGTVFLDAGNFVIHVYETVNG